MTIKVTTRHGEHPERMLQRFRRICSKEGIFREVKRRRFYEKPSAARRRKAKEAVRALKRALRRKERRKKTQKGAFL
jgi:small subunit ribosomal protein S21